MAVAVTVDAKTSAAGAEGSSGVGSLPFDLSEGALGSLSKRPKSTLKAGGA